jgi:hypothetical protein
LIGNPIEELLAAAATVVPHEVIPIQQGITADVQDFE